MISKELWGIYQGKEVYLYTIDNGCGLSAKITNIGCCVKDLTFNGCDVVLGFDDMDGYLNNPYSLGAVVGRTAGRVPNAEFTLNGVTYKLTKNQLNNNLHGGHCFRTRVWDIEGTDGDEPSVKLTYLSIDGDEGFPGNLTTTVTYTLTKDNSLKYTITGETDKDTPFNPTNHSYFNLNGHNSDRIYSHELKTYLDFYLPLNKARICSGEVLSVEGTPYDFREKKAIGDVILSDNTEMKEMNGIDHSFFTRGGYAKVASLYGDKTKIHMDVYTDLPSLVIYTTTGIDETVSYKESSTYLKHQAICFEPGFPPAAIEQPHFPSLILKKGEKYNHTTEFKFY